jgi:hypothetical protein
MTRTGRIEAVLSPDGKASTRQEEQVDSSFSFLSTTQAFLLNEILTRRKPALLERVRRADSVSSSDAEEIMTVMSEEFTHNLDDDWEPTEYGRTVSALMARFNAARIQEWP